MNTTNCDSDVLSALKCARLSFTPDVQPGMHRKVERGRFCYFDENGKRIRNGAALARIAALAIPPAWTDVWICPAARGHLQATGRDSRGRKQYRYHNDFRAAREDAKYAGLREFGLALPGLRQRVERDLRRPGLTRRKVLAAVVRLLDRTHLRIGNTEYVRANQSHGLTTLFDEHVSFRTGSMRLKFRGKSGVWHDRRIDDALLAKIVRDCRDLPGEELFQYLDPEGVPRVISAADVNEYIRAASGAHSAKTFRTWAASVRALALLRAEPAPRSETAARRTIAAMIRQVAGELGNTPAVCRKSYIHPVVLGAFLAGELQAASAVKPQAKMSADESRFLQMLR